jgi:carbon storage regulator
MFLPLWPSSPLPKLADSIQLDLHKAYKSPSLRGWDFRAWREHSREFCDGDFGMLVLSRRLGETVIIGGDIKVTVLSASKTQVRLGIAAPEEIRVLREEVYQRSLGGKHDDAPENPKGDLL